MVEGLYVLDWDGGTILRIGDSGLLELELKGL